MTGFKMHWFLVLVTTVSCMEIVSIPRANPPPPKRQSSSMTYLETKDALYLFGGYDQKSSSFQDTWAYRLNKSSWEELTPYMYTFPGKRSSSGSFVYSDEIICFFGGLGENGPLRDTWCYDVSALEVLVI